MSTALRTLTETEILAEIRNRFNGQHVSDLNIAHFVESSATVEELMIKIQTALELRENI